jgi:hypothetical protein
LEIINVGFDVIDLLLIRVLHSSDPGDSASAMDFMKVHDPVRREVLYNILIEFAGS